MNEQVLIQTVLNNAACFSATSPPLMSQTISDSDEDQTTTRSSGFTDLMGSSSLSVVEREACKDIHCDFDATCELGPDNFPRCTCRFNCSSDGLVEQPKPVCASDLRIYPSLCEMKFEACQRQDELRLRPLDLCQGEFGLATKIL